MFYLSTAQKGIDSPFDGIILAASQRYGVDVALIKGIISKESAWNPSAHSTSSHGLMQLNATYFHNPDGSPIYDPAQNIDIGTQTIAQQLARRPTMELALAGYNAGTSRSDADLAQRIAANTNGVGSYVNDVLEYYGWFWQNDPLVAGTGPGPDPLPLPPDGVPPGNTDQPSPVTPNQLLLILGITALGLLVVGLLRR
jgi:soluble lytic murein transglycosylase-like protein